MNSTFLMKRPLRAAVRGLQRILPAKAFNALYVAAYPAYKGIVRWAYLLIGFGMYRWSNSAKWRMVREVHRAMPHSLVGIGGLEATYLLAKGVNDRGLEGDFVELGVARGGCAALLGSTIFSAGRPETAEPRRLLLFDSFEGLPDPTNEDFAGDPDSPRTGEHVTRLTRGSCLGTLEDVRDLLLNKYGFPESGIQLVKGWFQNTVPAAARRISQIALLRIDGDWYESTKICLNHLYDRVVDGGVVIIDDYQSCYGCERAVDEFIRERRLQVEMRFDGRGGCYFLKRAQGGS